MKQLTAAEVRAAHSGATARGVSADPKSYFYLFYGTDGRVRAKIGNSFEEALSSTEEAGHDEGEWRIDAHGALCVRWAHWQSSAESCMRVYRSGKKFEAYLPNGRLALSYRVEAGTPSGF